MMHSLSLRHCRRVLLALLLAVVFVPAGAVVLRDDIPDEYVVVKGDTLWDISTHFLQDPWQWPEIWNNNPEIDNPHLIYPGDIIALRFINGKPSLTIRTKKRTTVHLKPKVRISHPVRNNLTIPVHFLQQFVDHLLIVQTDELDGLPRVEAIEDGHLIAGRDDLIFTQGLENPPYQRYSMVHVGAPIIDPYQSGKPLIGYQAVHTASAKVTELQGEKATLLIDSARQETRRQDYIFHHIPSQLFEDIRPMRPEQPVQGRVVELVNALSSAAKYQVVILNLGTEDGIKVGHLLDAVQESARSRIIMDRSQPKERYIPPARFIATLMVARVYPHASYAISLISKREIRRGDQVNGHSGL